ncbi:unnamed protein product [Tetraodon nigroviridis]|uniref:(spotted green pufferfish) hypothetical protein n=1 Tax=Tetraodon nigroviridis TaxID=99883 RepID=Q4S415_TETNG|nr:unnamed protein product [Tetraodon nigroviridis]
MATTKSNDESRDMEPGQMRHRVRHMSPLKPYKSENMPKIYR